MKRPPNHCPFRIFTSLASDTRPWTLSRTLRSNDPSDLRGELKGTASFRRKTGETNKACLTDLIYAEEGEMRGVGGSAAGLRWSRRYIWRFTATTVEEDGVKERIEDGESEAETTGAGTGSGSGKGMMHVYGDMSVWFVKPTASDEADYLFHTLQFDDAVDERSPTSGGSSFPSKAPVPPAVPDRHTKVLIARGHHLCVNDDYDTIYAFRIADDVAGEIVSWASRNMVSGPTKDQDIVNMYSRCAEHAE